jgi:proteasome lid subunit RPN8/RPN11
MADSEIQFGEVQETPCARRRRPDRDRHFAAVDYGSPAETDLPIFIAMEVLADLEDHAQSDTRVELGGVLLGGQYIDDDGCPFVVVTDSLRAEHYESAAGHFKFTHDTWEKISRQRDEFSDDLQMVGWYHTHPGWGVFLSGMDRFICDNFFNRPLDLAFVIDPVRNERGCFFWRQGAGEPLPQAAGFKTIASRFRRKELESFVAQLEGKIPMRRNVAEESAQPLAGLPAHVVHTIRPQFGWMAAGVLAVLVLQACLTLAVALRVGGPAPDRESAKSPAGRSEDVQRQLAALEDRLRREFAAEDPSRPAGLAARKEAFEAERRLFDHLVGQVRVGPEGVDVKGLVKENESQRDEIKRLRQELYVYSELAEHYEKLKNANKALADKNKALADDNKALHNSLQTIADSRDEALDKLQAANRRIVQLETPAPGAKSEDALAEKAAEAEDSADDNQTPQPGSRWRSPLALVVYAVAAVLALGAGTVAVGIWRKR